MTEYIEFEVFGVMLRYYDEERIERLMTGRGTTSGINKKNTAKWKTMTQTNMNGYKSICITDKNVRVHRVVFKAHNLSWDITDNSKNNFIDHIDMVRSNNKIENLRIATNQQNLFNTDAKGYCFHKGENKYQARIMRDSKMIHLGYFTKEADAHEAYLNAKLIYHKLV